MGPPKATKKAIIQHNTLSSQIFKRGNSQVLTTQASKKKKKKAFIKKKMVSWVRGKCIGRGSFGTVNVAVDRFNGDVFAVKSVDRNAALCHHMPAIQADCLENEIRILRSLSSPYIVKYLGDDVSYEAPTTSSSCRNLHLEYLPGGTVSDLATTLNAYADENTLRSHTYCIVSALKYLHSRNIVHCDVKGKNVLVGPNSSFVKLADFGAAGEATVSDTRGVKILPRGSPLWMAPEVVRGESQGPESDVWSLGCTIIEMVTGKPAWEDFGANTLSRIGFSDELPRFPTQLSELGRDFLDKCLRREPGERWSCDQLLKHPFLQSVSPSDANTVAESSPRCVLDWVNSEFEEEGTSDDEKLEASGRERMGKLAGSSGAIWEPNGWVAVRGGDDEVVEGGTRREYLNSVSSSASTGGGRSVNPESVGVKEEIETRVNWGLDNVGGCLSCRDGSPEVELAVEMKETGICRMRMCCKSLFLSLPFCRTRIFRYILLVACGICCYILFPFLFYFIY